jgi:hypothetical protein
LNIDEIAPWNACRTKLLSARTLSAAVTSGTFFCDCARQQHAVEQPLLEVNKLLGHSRARVGDLRREHSHKLAIFIAQLLLPATEVARPKITSKLKLLFLAVHVVH